MIPDFDPAWRDYHDELVSRGHARRRQLSAVIVGLARNLSFRLPNACRLLDSVGSGFAVSRVAVFENDSGDNTRDELLKYSQQQQTHAEVVILGATRGDPIWPQTRDLSRAQAMAGYRAECQEYVRRNPADVVLVLDLDVADYSDAGLSHTLGNDDWDFVGSYGLAMVREQRVQFDVWAFRDVLHPEPHTRFEINPRHYRLGWPIFPVLSCFGGLGVYRGEAYLAGTYSGGDCEHVQFHKSIQAAGYRRFFLNPNQYVLY